MDKKRLIMLECLERYYINAQGICDPIDYQVRQRDLSYQIARFFLEELEEYRKSLIDKEGL